MIQGTALLGESTSYSPGKTSSSNQLGEVTVPGSLWIWDAKILYLIQYVSMPLPLKED